MKKIFLSMLLLFIATFLIACQNEEIPGSTPTVTINSVGSTFESEMIITIEAVNADVIYFSYDGTTFSEYTNALLITETTTVYAKAENENGMSDVINATFTKVISCTGTLVDGVCITGQAEKLYLSMADLSETDQFQISISIDDGDMITAANIIYDGNLSSFSVGSSMVIYQDLDGILLSYTKQGNTFIESDLGATTNHLFFLNFNYDQFTYANDLYLLNYGQYDTINSFVIELIPDGTASNFAITLTDDVIASMNFDIQVDLAIYHTEMIFSYEPIDIVVPIIEGGNNA